MIEQIRRKYRGLVIPAALTAATAITVATSLFNHTLLYKSVRNGRQHWYAARTYKPWRPARWAGTTGFKSLAYYQI